MSAEADTGEHVLSAHTREEIDHWLTKYPTEQRRSAVAAALRAAQHQNHGYLTTELMDGVAEYLDCLLYTSPSPRDRTRSRMPSSA